MIRGQELGEHKHTPPSTASEINVLTSKHNNLANERQDRSVIASKKKPVAKEAKSLKQKASKIVKSFEQSAQNFHSITVANDDAKDLANEEATNRLLIEIEMG